ncbi:acyltransferase family protein [Sphingomonas sp. Tas61C01]|uniref:acyltransferase family protein n=1 Tax=Sphingomonas sp. Tas61C01 TaxID=3458297 RepID=UPI00403ECAED
MTSTQPVPTRNNLDIVRFTLAAMVLVSHAHDLSGVGALSFLSRLISSTLAVQAFFVISGFLIFQSYERSRTLQSYAAKRIRRIYPAYAMVILVCGFGLGLASSLSPGAYFADGGLWRYLAANLVFLNFLGPDLPGVFANNPVQAVNGALWTLKIEVAFYIAVPVCVWLFRSVGRTPTLILLYIASFLYGMAMTWFAAARHSGAFLELGRQLPGQMTYFVAGAAIYYHHDRLGTRPIVMIVTGLALFLLSGLVLAPLFRPVAVALMVMGVAFGPYLGRFGRYGDFSYGIYIVHFPILQLLVALAAPAWSVTGFLLTGMATALLCAVLMWHLVEKRFLRRDSHYRAEVGTNTAG